MSNNNNTYLLTKNNNYNMYGFFHVFDQTQLVTTYSPTNQVLIISAKDNNENQIRVNHTAIDHPGRNMTLMRESICMGVHHINLITNVITNISTNAEYTLVKNRKLLEILPSITFFYNQDNIRYFSNKDDYKLFIKNCKIKKTNVRGVILDENLDVLVFDNDKKLLAYTISYFNLYRNNTNNIIYHNLKIIYNDGRGADAGGLTRDYFTKLSKEVAVFFGDKKNITNFECYKNEIQTYGAILTALYETNVSILSFFNIKYLLKCIFIDKDVDFTMIAYYLFNYEFNFHDIIINFIHINLEFNITKEKFYIKTSENQKYIADIENIIKNPEHYKVVIWLFAEYFMNDFSNNATVETIDYLYNNINDYWDEYNISTNFKKLLVEISSNSDTNNHNLNIFSMFSYFHYNININYNDLIDKIVYENISHQLRNNFLQIFKNYQATLNDSDINNYSNFGDQQQFLSMFLYSWTGSNFLHNRKYYIKGFPAKYFGENSSGEIGFWFHTCFFTIDANVDLLNSLSVYDLTKLILNSIDYKSSNFNVAG